MRGSWFALLVALAGCDRAFGLERDTLAPGDWAFVAAGDRHTCGIRLDGSMWCWGANDSDQLGLLNLDESAPRQLGEARWTSVSSTNNNTCGIQEDGSLWCWGENANAQLGLGDGSRRAVPTRVDGGPWATVHVGQAHSCGIGVDGLLSCWGYNVYGQIGNNTILSTTVPTPVHADPDHKWSGVAVGSYHTCAVRDDESLWCWGLNNSGQLADPNSGQQLEPHRAPGSWTKVTAAGVHTCALGTSGQLHCWGDNSSGQLGNGTTRPSVVGTDVGGGANDWVDVVSGGVHVCGLRRDGSLHCWGDNSSGQIPSPDVGVVAAVPIDVTAISADPTKPFTGTWTQLALGAAHTCAIDDEHRLWCAGANGGGQLGRGTPSHLVPVRVPGEWTDVDLGDLSTCALDAEGTAHCWGGNDTFQLGDSTGLPRQLPTAIDATGRWEAVTVGGRFACVRRGETRACWGQNENGQLGDAMTNQVYIPKLINDGIWPSSAGQQFACGTDLANVYCWGRNDFGQLGAGDLMYRDRPAALAGPIAGPWYGVATGTLHGCAIGILGLYCWGYNGAGQLGDGGTTSTNQAVRATPMIFDSISVSSAASCALKNGDPWCWGSNTSGQFGDGTVTAITVPTPMASGRWKQLSLGESHVCGISDTGALKCWGSNSRGELGIGTLDSPRVPQAVGTDTTWTKVVAGYLHTCAIKADRSLWCWGRNDNGQLGDGTAWFDRLELVP